MRTSTHIPAVLILLAISLFLATAQAVQKTPLNLETGHLALYRPWTGTEQIQSIQYSMPLWIPSDHKLVVGIKTMSIEEREKEDQKITSHIQIWLGT